MSTTPNKTFSHVTQPVDIMDSDVEYDTQSSTAKLKNSTDRLVAPPIRSNDILEAYLADQNSRQHDNRLQQDPLPRKLIGMTENVSGLSEDMPNTEEVAFESIYNRNKRNATYDEVDDTEEFSEPLNKRFHKSNSFHCKGVPTGRQDSFEPSEPRITPRKSMDKTSAKDAQSDECQAVMDTIESDELLEGSIGDDWFDAITVANAYLLESAALGPQGEESENSEAAILKAKISMNFEMTSDNATRMKTTSCTQKDNLTTSHNFDNGKAYEKIDESCEACFISTDVVASEVLAIDATRIPTDDGKVNETLHVSSNLPKSIAAHTFDDQLGSGRACETASGDDTFGFDKDIEEGVMSKSKVNKSKTSASNDSHHPIEVKEDLTKPPPPFDDDTNDKCDMRESLGEPIERFLGKSEEGLCVTEPIPVNKLMEQEMEQTDGSNLVENDGSDLSDRLACESKDLSLECDYSVEESTLEATKNKNNECASAEVFKVPAIDDNNMVCSFNRDVVDIEKKSLRVAKLHQY